MLLGGGIFTISLMWKTILVIQSFHMPLFFILSGVLFKKLSHFELLKKSWHQLLVPYFSMSLFIFICVTLYFYFHDTFDYAETKSHLIGILSANDFYKKGLNFYSGPLWFCYALFLVKLIMNIICSARSLLLKVLILCMGFSILFIDNMIPLRIDSAFIGSVFFAFGFYIKDVIFSIEQKSGLVKCAIICFSGIVMYICSIFNLDFEGGTMLSINMNRYGEFPLLFLVSGISGSFVVIGIASLLSKFKYDVIEILSNGTIIILGFHWILFKMLPQFFYHENVIVCSFLSIMNMCACYLLILFANKYFPFLIGGRKLLSK